MSQLLFKENYLKKIQQVYDLMADEYDILDQRINPFDVNGFKALDEVVHSLKAHWEGRCVLDVGCGTGIQTMHYAKGAKEVIACDISCKALEQAQKKTKEIGVTNVHLIAADACNLPLNDASMDYVAAYGDVIGHIPDYERAMSEMARVCKKGGVVTIEYDNKWHLGVLFTPKTLLKAIRTKGNGDERIWRYEYLTYDLDLKIKYKTFTFPEMMSLMTKYGLQIIQNFGINTLSSIVPEKYHAYSRNANLLFPIFARLAVMLGHIDRKIKNIAPFYRIGFTSVVVAQKV